MNQSRVSLLSIIDCDSMPSAVLNYDIMRHTRACNSRRNFIPGEYLVYTIRIVPIYIPRFTGFRDERIRYNKRTRSVKIDEMNSPDPE